MQFIKKDALIKLQQILFHNEQDISIQRNWNFLCYWHKERFTLRFCDTAHVSNLRYAKDTQLLRYKLKKTAMFLKM